MTSPRHPRSRLRAALGWAIVACAGLGIAAVQSPAGGQPAAPAGPQAPSLALVPEWTTPLPGAPVSAPARDGNHLVVPLRDESLLAVAIDSGAIAWQAQAGPDARVTAGGGLAFASVPGALIAFDAASGAERWRHAPSGPITATPAWNNGWLLIGTAEGRLTMLRAAEGRPLWTRDLGAALRDGTVMTGDRLYVMLEDGRVVALSLDRGQPLWERALPARGTALSALDDRVFVGGDDRFFYCLAADDGDVKWRWRAGGAIAGTPVVDADSVYFLSLDNVLRALNRGNGHQRWKRGLSFRPIGGPVAAGDLLLVPGLTPELPAFRAATGAPAGTVPLGGEAIAPPLLLPGVEPGIFSIVIVTGETVLRLGPPPPVLESHPIPGLPLFLELPQDPLAPDYSVPAASLRSAAKAR